MADTDEPQNLVYTDVVKELDEPLTEYNGGTVPNPDMWSLASKNLDSRPVPKVPEKMNALTPPKFGVTNSGSSYIYGVASSYGYPGDRDNGFNSLGMKRGTQPWYGEYPTVALNPEYAKKLGVELPSNKTGSWDTSKSYVTLHYNGKTTVAIYDETGMYIHPNAKNKAVDLTPEASEALGIDTKTNALGVVVVSGKSDASDSYDIPSGIIPFENIPTATTISMPNFSPQTPPTGLDPTIGGTDAPKGSFSTPIAGAKVWVFFHGGDTQRPVYFASSPEPAAWKSALKASSPALAAVNTGGRGPLLSKGPEANNNISFYTKNPQEVNFEFVQSDYVGSSGGGQRNTSHFFKRGDGQMFNKSTNISQCGRSKTKSGSGGTTVSDDKSISEETTVKSSNTGTKNTYNSNESLENNEGHYTLLVGNHRDSGMNAAKEVQKHVDAIEKAKSDAIKGGGDDVVDCPVCSQKYLADGAGCISSVIELLSQVINMLPWNCWNWPITKFFMDLIIVPSLDETTGLEVSGGKGCGVCDGGKLKSPKSKIEAGNEAGAKELKNRQGAIDEASKSIKEASYTNAVNGDITVKAGGVTNRSPAYNDTGNIAPIPTGSRKGSNAPIVHTTAAGVAIVVKNEVTQTVGSILIDSANKLKLLAGSPGIDILTKGTFTVNAGGIELISTDGPLTISSKNVTNVNGKAVVISAADDGGVRMQSRNTSFGGAVCIEGDQAVMGSISTDGSISTKHLNVLSMRGETTMSSSAKSVTDKATWALQGAVALDLQEKVMTAMMRDQKTGWALTPSAIITLIQEAYSTIMLAITIEPVPIGWTVSYPSGIQPVFGFTHTHGLTPQDHNHQITVPKGNYYNDTESWHQARPETSSVPTPAPGSGDGPTPGPKSIGGCGGCGSMGGGAGFGNPDSGASISRNIRNASYGLSDGNYDYNTITNVKYDESGELIPKARFGLNNEDC